MTLNRYAKRIDANQPEIVSGLRHMGAAVWVLSTPADLLVGARGRFLTAEIKDGEKPPSRRQLTPEEAAYAGTCERLGLPHFVWLSLEDAIQDTFGAVP